MRKVTATVLLVGMLLPAACSKDEQNTESRRDTHRTSDVARANQAPRQGAQQDETSADRWNQPQTTANQINPNGQQQQNPNVTPATPGPTTQQQEAQANPAILGTTASVNTTVASTYKVQAGDSLWKIAERFSGKGYNCELLKKFNNLPSDDIRPGQILNIPPQWRPAAARTAAATPQPAATTSVLMTKEGTVAVPTTTAQPTEAPTAAKVPNPTEGAATPLGTMRNNGVVKQYYAVPDSTEMNNVAASVAAGRQTWRTDMMEVARTTLAQTNSGVSSATLWPIRSADGSHALVMLLDGNNIVGVEAEKHASGVWYPVATTSSSIPYGYTAGDFASRNIGLASQLLKTRVNW